MSSDKEILALEDKRYAAMCGGDFAALEAMLHDELLYTHSSGLTDTKATWLASLRSGKTKYKSATCSDRKVRLAGDTALVTGRAAIEAENQWPAAQLEARVPQCLDTNAEGLEIHRVAVDAAARHIAMGVRPARPSRYSRAPTR
jgi:ketosteroid isomerase-like protein